MTVNAKSIILKDANVRVTVGYDDFAQDPIKEMDDIVNVNVHSYFYERYDSGKEIIEFLQEQVQEILGNTNDTKPVTDILKVFGVVSLKEAFEYGLDFNDIYGCVDQLFEDFDKPDYNSLISFINQYGERYLKGYHWAGYSQGDGGYFIIDIDRQGVSDNEELEKVCDSYAQEYEGYLKGDVYDVIVERPTSGFDTNVIGSCGGFINNFSGIAEYIADMVVLSENDKKQLFDFLTGEFYLEYENDKKDLKEFLLGSD